MPIFGYILSDPSPLDPHIHLPTMSSLNIKGGRTVFESDLVRDSMTFFYIQNVTIGVRTYQTSILFCKLSRAGKMLINFKLSTMKLR